jgi:O-antigen ligase
MPYSDFSTSGGYGPNQVSTMFGLGVVAIIAAKVLQLNLTSSKYIDLLILIVFFVLGTITFSRGGIFSAIIAIIGSISLYFFYDQKKVYMISKSLGIFLISVIVWIAIVSVTDGVIMQRYGFGNSEFGERFILDLTGRALIYEIDLNIFIDHIFTGVGPGQATELREVYGYGKQVVAHTEYSRMLAEHGIAGLFSLLILIGISVTHLFRSYSKSGQFIKVIFGILAILTLSHSAMRLAMPSFIYGFLFINYKE